MPCVGRTDHTKFPQPVVKKKEPDDAVYGQLAQVIEKPEYGIPKAIAPICASLHHHMGIDDRKYIELKRDADLLRKETNVRSHIPIISKDNFERIKKFSKGGTLHAADHAFLKQQEEIGRLRKIESDTKKMFKAFDDERIAAKMRAIGRGEVQRDEAEEERNDMLRKAYLARQENEDEIRQCNHIIYEAQCQAVRDAQKQENATIRKAKRERELQMDMQMLKLNSMGQGKDDVLEEQRRKDRVNYSKAIKNQILQRDNLRMLETEHIEAEAESLRQLRELIKQDEDREARIRRDRQEHFRNELDKLKQMQLLFRKLKCEQEKELDRRNDEYVAFKNARDKELKKRAKEIRNEFLEKQKRLFNVQLKVLESHDNRDQMAWLKEQEKSDREYRQQQKELAQKKHDNLIRLNEDRKAQMQESKHREAMQLALAEKEFKTLMESIKRAEEKENMKDAERAKAAKCYRMEVINQMNNNEKARLKLMEITKNEVDAWRDSARQRNDNIRELVESKMQTLKESCLPEKYIADIERQLRKLIFLREGDEGKDESSDANPKRPGDFIPSCG